MELGRGFEADAQAALLDAAERELVGRTGNLVFQAIQRSHEVLRSVGATEEYDIEPIIDSLGEVEVNRTDGAITARWGWTHEAAPFFEFGTRPHTVEGDPVLAFRWEDAPPEVREQFAETFPVVFFQSVDVDGIEEAAFVRAGLSYLRQQLR
jgi:hypothetical protein